MECVQRLFLLLVDQGTLVGNINFNYLNFSCYTGECRVKSNGISQCDACNPVKEEF